MHLDLAVKIPQDTLNEASENIRSLPCLRKEFGFVLSDGKWSVRQTCHGYGNGFGATPPCQEKCKLRITDLEKCEERDSGISTYLIQPEFFSPGGEDNT